jgi:hypothetical protein
MLPPGHWQEGTNRNIGVEILALVWLKALQPARQRFKALDGGR